MNYTAVWNLYFSAIKSSVVVFSVKNMPWFRISTSFKVTLWLHAFTLSALMKFPRGTCQKCLYIISDEFQLRQKTGQVPKEQLVSFLHLQNWTSSTNEWGSLTLRVISIIVVMALVQKTLLCRMVIAKRLWKLELAFLPVFKQWQRIWYSRPLLKNSAGFWGACLSSLDKDMDSKSL